MTENEVAREIVDAAYKIHRMFGPGLLESAYEAMLAHELQKRGLRVRRQVPIPLVYEDLRVEEAYRADLLVEEIVIVELKAVEEMPRCLSGRHSRTSSSPGNVSAFSSTSANTSSRTASTASPTGCRNSETRGKQSHTKKCSRKDRKGAKKK